MKCPYCGAELQENARFCLYCMKPLQEKRQIDVPRTRKRRLLALIAVAVAAAVALLLFFSLRQSADLPPAAEEPTQLTVDEKLPAITDQNTFYFSAADAAERMGTADLWAPSSMWFPDATRAVVPLSRGGADCQIIFLQDGRAILAAITDLTDETLADSRRVAESICAAVYDGIADPPALEAELPTAQAERSVIERLKIDDPAQEGTVTAVAQCRLEPVSFGDQGRQYLLYELRTRSCEDGTHYDIFLYFGQE